MTKIQSYLIYLLWLVPAAFCIGALWSHPYAYYEWLRIVVGLPAAMLAGMSLLMNARGGIVWAAVLGLVAFLFNPFAPVHLSRELWAPIDVAAAIVFVGHMIWIARHDRSKDGQPPRK